jgi:hypothetical protein
MPIDYEIDEKEKLIVATGSGIVTGNEVQEHLESLANDNRYIAPMKKLVDYSSIDSIRISQDEADRIAQIKKRHIDTFVGEKCAFVSPGDLTYGTARVHQALIHSTDINTQVFRNIKEAKAWLDEK